MSIADSESQSQTSHSDLASVQFRNINPNKRNLNHLEAASSHYSSEKNLDAVSDSSIFRNANPNKKTNSDDFDSVTGSQQGDISHFRSNNGVNQIVNTVRSRSSEKNMPISEENIKMPPAFNKSVSLQSKFYEKNKIDEKEERQEDETKSIESAHEKSINKLDKLETIVEYPESLKKVSSSPNFKNDLRRNIPNFEEFSKFNGDRKSSIENVIMINSLREFEKLYHMSTNTTIHNTEKKEEMKENIEKSNAKVEASTQASFQMNEMNETRFFLLEG